MKLKFRYTERFVGVFIATAMLILIIIIGLVIADKKLFQKKYEFKTKFNDAVGLSTTTPIYFKGYKIGSVKEFTLNEFNEIEAIVEIYEEFRNKIIQESAFNKLINPITSTSSIEFLEGPNSTKLLAENGFIPSLDLPEGKLLLSLKKVRRSGDVVSSVIANIDEFFTNLNLDDNSGEGAVFRALVNFADLSEKMNSLTDNVVRFLGKLEKDKNYDDGALFRALNNAADISEKLQDVTNKLDYTLSLADTLILNYKNPEGLAGKLLDPDGTLILKPMEEVLKTSNQTLLEVSEFMKYINSKSDELSSLAVSLQIVLRETQKTLETLNNNPIINFGYKPSQKYSSSGNKINIKDLDLK